jgi:uncharacterized protein DUF4406
MEGVKLYISGPMTGIPDFNFPAFEKAVEQLQAAGYEVMSPHWHGSELGDAGWAEYVRRDLIDMLGCEGVATLPGVENSRGATLECHVARELGMEIRPVEEWL